MHRKSGFITTKSVNRTDTGARERSLTCLRTQEEEERKKKIKIHIIEFYRTTMINFDLCFRGCWSVCVCV